MVVGLIGLAWTLAYFGHFVVIAVFYDPAYVKIFGDSDPTILTIKQSAYITSSVLAALVAVLLLLFAARLRGASPAAKP